jgi:hypothetical protein
MFDLNLVNFPIVHEAMLRQVVVHGHFAQQKAAKQTKGNGSKARGIGAAINMIWGKERTRKATVARFKTISQFPDRKRKREANLHQFHPESILPLIHKNPSTSNSSTGTRNLKCADTQGTRKNKIITSTNAGTGPANRKPRSRQEAAAQSISKMGDGKEVHAAVVTLKDQRKRVNCQLPDRAVTQIPPYEKAQPKENQTPTAQKGVDNLPPRRQKELPMLISNKKRDIWVF